MSRGLGAVQRGIRRAFLANPDRVFHTTDLLPWAYPRLKEFRRQHRWWIVVAAKRVAVRLGRDKHGVIFGAKQK